MKIKDKWLEIREGIIVEIEKEDSILGIKNILLETLEKLQYAVMGDEKNIRLRQEIGLLFVNTKGNFEVLNIVGNINIWSLDKRKEKTRSYYWLGAYMLINLILVFLLVKRFQVNLSSEAYKDLAWIGGVLVLYLGTLVASLNIYKRKMETSKVTHKAEVNIEKQRVIAYIDNTVETLDRYIEELRILNNEERELEGRLSRETLVLFQTLYEGINLKNEVLIKGLEKNIGSILAENMIEKLEYSKENEKYFDILPSKTMEITIKPSFIKKEGGEVILRGMATRKIN